MLQLLFMSLSLILIAQNNLALAQLNYCWNPSIGAQVNCTAPNNVYCSTDFTTGIGACSADNSNSTLVYCQGSDGCNKFVTQCYNPANRTRGHSSERHHSSSLSGYVACDSAGANQYCQVKKVFFLSFIKPNLFNYLRIYYTS